jgi:mannose-6-phosphate isomerase
MTATRLSTISVEKPWGRRDLGFGFPDVAADGAPIGEIWFETPPGNTHDLMVKYLFTSERLSIQVHPSDAQARERGLPCGKEEAWIILAAEPEATIAMGTTRPVSGDELRAAALDGSIEALMDWKPVSPGNIFYLPAGTVHAIGAGITLIEVQQNVDVTYRLYDYGRARELHLDDGIAVSRGEPFICQNGGFELADGRAVLVSGRKFVVEKWTWDGARSIELPIGALAWLIPMVGHAEVSEQHILPGECWEIRRNIDVMLSPGAEILFAYSGPSPLPLFPAT